MSVCVSLEQSMGIIGLSESKFRRQLAGPKETDVEKPQAFVPEDSEEDVGKQAARDF